MELAIETSFRYLSSKSLGKIEADRIAFTKLSPAAMASYWQEPTKDQTIFASKFHLAEIGLPTSSDFHLGASYVPK